MMIIAAFIVSIILWLFAPVFVRLISGSNEPVVLSNGAMYLRIVGPFYAVLGILFDVSNLLTISP